jgi:hypothetical protein
MKKNLAGALAAVVMTGLISANSMADTRWGISIGASFGHGEPHFRHPGFGHSEVRWSGPRISAQLYFAPSFSSERREGWWEDREDVARQGREIRQDVRDLIQVLHFGTPKERKEAARELGRLPFDEVVSALSSSLLGDPESDVREEAARSLGKLVAEDARPALRYAARNDASHEVREAAAKALEQLGPEPYQLLPRGREEPRDGLRRLVRQLDSVSKSDRQEAAKKLGDWKDPLAVAALVDALASDPEKKVREEAAKALGRIGDPSALPALRQAELRDGEKNVRKAAEKAIDKITD